MRFSNPMQRVCNLLSWYNQSKLLDEKGVRLLLGEVVPQFPSFFGVSVTDN
jgi:hypothetical protein